MHGETFFSLLVRLMQVGQWQRGKLLVYWGHCISLNVLFSL